MGDRLAHLAGWAAGAADRDDLRVLLIAAGDPGPAAHAIAADAGVGIAVITGGYETGLAAADRAADAGFDAVIVTADASPVTSAALVALLTRASAADVTTPKDDDADWMNACERVREAMLDARPHMGSPQRMLACLDDDALSTAAGAIAGASRRGLGVLLDDAACCAAALAVAREERALTRTWLAGVRTGEPAQHRALDWLELEAVLDLGGERTAVGAIAALGVIRAAVTAVSP